MSKAYPDHQFAYFSIVICVRVCIYILPLQLRLCSDHLMHRPHCHTNGGKIIPEAGVDCMLGNMAID
jgi:hypothetical protein